MGMERFKFELGHLYVVNNSIYKYEEYKGKGAVNYRYKYVGKYNNGEIEFTDDEIKNENNVSIEIIDIKDLIEFILVHFLSFDLDFAKFVASLKFPDYITHQLSSHKNLLVHSILEPYKHIHECPMHYKCILKELEDNKKTSFYEYQILLYLTKYYLSWKKSDMGSFESLYSELVDGWDYYKDFILKSNNSVYCASKSQLRTLINNRKKEHKTDCINKLNLSESELNFYNKNYGLTYNIKLNKLVKIGITVEEYYINQSTFNDKYEKYLENDVNINNGLGRVHKPNWLDNEEDYIYLFTKRNKSSQIGLIGYYKYYNKDGEKGFTYITDDFVGEIPCKIYRLESLVYYLLHEKTPRLRLSKFKALIDTKFANVSCYKNKSFTFDELVNDYLNKYKDVQFSIYSYNALKEKKRLDEGQKREYLDSLSEEDRDEMQLKAMMATITERENNEKLRKEKELEWRKKQKEFQDRLEKRIEMSEELTPEQRLINSINKNNYIRKINDLGDKLEVYITYKFYSLKNQEDKKAFLKVLSSKLKYQSIDVSQYKIASIQNTKYYSDCILVVLNKR